MDGPQGLHPPGGREEVSLRGGLEGGAEDDEPDAGAEAACARPAQGRGRRGGGSEEEGADAGMQFITLA